MSSCQVASLINTFMVAGGLGLLVLGFAYAATRFITKGSGGGFEARPTG